MEDSIAKPLSGVVERLVEVLVPAISQAVSEEIGAAIAGLTGSSLAPVPSLESGKSEHILSPALSATDVIVPEQAAIVEDLKMECVLAPSKRRVDQTSNTAESIGLR